MQIVVLEANELQRLIDNAVEKAIDKLNRPQPALIQDNNKLISINEVADLLQVSVSSVNTYKRQGSIPFYRLGRRVFFKESEVLKSLKKISQ